MKHLFIQQKVLALRDRFKVYDEQEKEKYQVEGKFFSIGKKLRILKGELELARIEQEIFHILAHYNIHVEGRGDFKIIRKFNLLKPIYRLEGIDWSIEGDFWAHDYRIIDSSNKEIAQLSKRWISLGDAYDIQINKNEDELLVLSIVIAIDADKDNANSVASASSSSSD